MKIFDTKEEAIEFAKNAPETFKLQLNFIKNRVFETSSVHSVITSDFEVLFNAKIQFIPTKFKFMISVGNYVVYLVCDVIVSDLVITDLEERNIDFNKILDLTEYKSDSLKRLFPFFRNEPISIFHDYAKLIGLDDVILEIDEILIK
jgi:hypothetical protein